MDESLARQESWMHRMDPCVRVITAVIVSFCAALCHDVNILVGHVLMSLVLVGMAKLPPVAVFKRLKPLFWFLVMIWVVMPFTHEGEPLVLMGPVALTRPGVMLCVNISLKSVTILLYFMALVATMTVATLGQALHCLHVPDKMIFLLLMTYRYISVIQSEYHRLLRAAKFRGFVPGTNIHSYRTYAYLAGMLFVRASRRAARVYDAMRCRGFNGKFHTLDTFSPGVVNHLFLTLVSMTALGLVVTETLLM
ncbi:cobalt/nickel transport system permease protein [Desulfocicer vacuolatum DSM 3385]|uniref:Cobalt/nickel transport system permease protein n=1 Tax=Desulfocicer vacuolatum DSM 3385 TaxID=1121400 RepID=A0A1W1ZC57_9BACT|nr:cobalt ECF transporter T component CbiQ [Desulfocicer vacuolatum]SMC45916.1 cobalt/nickel transport system permease protein [Desulfocicer vacuolatum DSM 3385]